MPVTNFRWARGLSDEEVDEAIERAKLKLTERLSPFAGKRIRFRMIKSYEGGCEKEWTYGTLATAPEQLSPELGYQRQPWGYRFTSDDQYEIPITAEDLIMCPEFEVYEA